MEVFLIKSYAKRYIEKNRKNHSVWSFPPYPGMTHQFATAQLPLESQDYSPEIMQAMRCKLFAYSII